MERNWEKKKNKSEKEKSKEKKKKWMKTDIERNEEKEIK